MSKPVQFALPNFLVIPEDPNPRLHEMIIANPLANSVDGVAQKSFDSPSPNRERSSLPTPPSQSPQKSPKRNQENSPCNTPTREKQVQEPDEEKELLISPIKFLSPSRTHHTSPLNKYEGNGRQLFAPYEIKKAMKKIKGKPHHTVMPVKCYGDAAKIRANRLKPNSEGTLVVPHEDGEAHYRFHKAGEAYRLYPSHTSTLPDMIHLSGKQFSDLYQQFQSSNTSLDFREFIRINIQGNK